MNAVASPHSLRARQRLCLSFWPTVHRGRGQDYACPFGLVSFWSCPSVSCQITVRINPLKTNVADLEPECGRLLLQQGDHSVEAHQIPRVEVACLSATCGICLPLCFSGKLQKQLVRRYQVVSKRVARIHLSAPPRTPSAMSLYVNDYACPFPTPDSTSRLHLSPDGPQRLGLSFSGRQ
jgi:hypothetical protein